MGSGARRDMNVRNLAIWGAIALLVIGMAVAMGGNPQATRAEKAKLSVIYELVEDGKIADATLGDQRIIVTTTDGRTMVSELRSLDMTTQQFLEENQVPFTVDADSGQNTFASLIFSILPILLIVGFVFFMMRQMQSGGGRGAMSFGKSRARLLTEKHGRVTFDDVAGVDEAKEELQEIVEFLQDPSKFQRLGGKIPKGALLVGPPGTGKTLLARAVAGEAGVPFFTMSGSDFVEMFVGVGAARVRDLFKQAKEKAPCIIFIDEVDAIGRSRGRGAMPGSNDERENTLNSLLVEVDGFSTDSGVIIMAATNRPDILDSALLRPGRFDRQISIDRPDLKGRKAIFEVHLKNIKIAEGIRSEQLAEMTSGFAGADIANICNEAALVAARRNKSAVDLDDFNHALDRVIGGLE